MGKPVTSAALSAFKKRVGIGYVEMDCGCIYDCHFEYSDLVSLCFRHEVQRIRRRELLRRAAWAVYWIGGLALAAWWTWG